MVHKNPENQEGCVYKGNSQETRNAHTSLQHRQEIKAVTFVGNGDDNDDVFEATDNDILQCMLYPFKHMIESSMEDHILEMHIDKEDDNLYHCQEGCQFTCSEKNELANHFKTYHREKEQTRTDSGEAVPLKQTPGNNRLVVNDSNESSVESSTTRNPGDTANAEESVKVKAEMKMLRRNFERLEGMYHQSLEEVNQVKSEYEAKLILANDSFRDAKQENETLKERVDILFKLGKSYLEKDKKVEKNENADIIEVLEDDNTDPTRDELPFRPQNRMRGFRRVNPSTIPNSIPLGGEANMGKKQDQTPNERNSDEQQKQKPNFCHFFVNFGRCNFQSRTRQRCKFERKEAPSCNYGPGCTRTKCQFSHPRAKPFLERRQFAPSPPWLNPWQTPNNHGAIRNQQVLPPVSSWQVNPWMNQWSPQYQSEYPPLERHQGVRG